MTNRQERPVVKARLALPTPGAARADLLFALYAPSRGGAGRALLTATFLNADGARIPPPYVGWRRSRTFDAYVELPVHRTVSSAARSLLAPDRHTVDLPRGAASVDLSLRAWKPAGGTLRVLRPPRLAANGALEETTASLLADNACLAELTAPLGDGVGLLRVQVERCGAGWDKGLILILDQHDGEGRRLPPPYTGFWRSEVGAYRYVDVPGGGSDEPSNLHTQHFVVTTAPGARTATARLFSWSVPRSALPAVKMTFEATPSSATLLEAQAQASSDSALTTAAIAAAQREGDLQVQLRLLGSLPSKPDGLTAKRINLLSGHLRELSPSWFPVVPGPPERLSRRAEPVRVCHLMKVCRPYEDTGGAIRNFNTVASQLDAGLAPYVVTPIAYPRTDDVPDSMMTTLSGVRHYHLDVGGADPSRWRRDDALQLEVSLAASVVRGMGADVIHAASGYRGYDGALKGIALARHFDLPLVYEVRSLHEHTWAPAAEGTDEMPQTLLRRRREDQCMAIADHVVTIAEAMRDLLVRRGVSPDKVTVVPNAVDRHWFEESPRFEAEAAALRKRHGLRGTVLGYVSNLSGREGHAVLIEATGRLIAEGRDVSCLLVGDGPSRAALEAQVAAAGLAGRVVFTGNVPHDDVRAAYEAIDIFVVPRIADYASDYVTPMKPFEALALRRPLVMSDRPVANEIVGTEERGLLFRTGDASHLAHIVARLIDDGDTASRLGEAGRDWVRSARRWDRNAEAYRALYDVVIEGHGAR